MNVARYLRVSTDKQSTENQEPDIGRLMAAREGEGKAFDDSFSLATYREIGSAAKERPEFSKMMEDARLGKFRTLYIWSLDRFGRSMFQNLRDLRLLVETYRVKVISVREPWVEATSDRMTRELLLSVLGWVAEFERERLVQRTRAGLARARTKGTRLGRPPVAIPSAVLDTATSVRRTGAPWREIAKGLERAGLGKFSHGALAAACLKRVPDLPRGKPGWQRSAAR